MVLIALVTPSLLQEIARLKLLTVKSEEAFGHVQPRSIAGIEVNGKFPDPVDKWALQDTEFYPADLGAGESTGG